MRRPCCCLLWAGLNSCDGEEHVAGLVGAYYPSATRLRRNYRRWQSVRGGASSSSRIASTQLCCRILLSRALSRPGGKDRGEYSYSIVEGTQHATPERQKTRYIQSAPHNPPILPSLKSLIDHDPCSLVLILKSDYVVPSY
jgi:hypothetical protein